MDLEPIYSVALEAALEGRRTLSHHAGNRAPVVKGFPGDVVTEVDRLAEERIRGVIRDRRPDDLVVGEELPDSGNGLTGVEWYIDPIDGTSNFVHGIDLYCSSVAAYDRKSSRWLVGVVAMANSGVLYSAARGQGARMHWADGTSHVLSARGPQNGPRLLGVGLSYDRSARPEQLREMRSLMESYDDMRSLGTAAYALCLVAQGALASFVETDLFPFDWAAGALIAEEAGAIVDRPAGLTRGAVRAHGFDSPAHPFSSTSP
jgi:myo-inositol-1(or 4)-monophosphatase